MGITTVAVYSEADGDLPYVREADHAVFLGPAPPAQSYLNAAEILRAAREAGASAIHPGYGFLAERASFARQVIAAGLTWVGPAPEAIEQMGDKIRARNLMAAAGVPVSPGSAEPVLDEDTAVTEANRIGYPVMVKAAGGGGGIGMSAASSEAGLRAAFATARSRAERFFGHPDILIERYIVRARHVEVQILGLADGRVIALGERDCSVQRRHQKVAEETPSPGIGPDLRERMQAAAVPGRRGGRVPERRHRRMPRRRRRRGFHLPGDEYPAPGRASGHRTGHRHRPGRAAVPDRRRPGRLVGPASFPSFQSPRPAATPSSCACTPRTRSVPAGPGRITEWAEPSGEGIRVDAGYIAGNTVSRSTTRCWPSSARTGPAGRGAGEGAGAVAAFRIRARRRIWPFTPTCWPAPSSPAATTTRLWWPGCGPDHGPGQWTGTGAGGGARARKGATGGGGPSGNGRERLEGGRGGGPAGRRR